MSTVVVIGAGVAGLGAAWALERARPDLDVIVLEAGLRIGGAVETERTMSGFVLEHGPDSVLQRKPSTTRMIDRLTLDHELVRGTGARRTYVVRDGTLSPLPESLMGIAPSAVFPVLRSPLLSLGAKLRLALEPWIRRRASDADESIEDFVLRRFGRGFLDAVVEPMLSAVYGERATELSAKSLMPELTRAEREAGSVTRALATRRKQATGGGASPFVTFRGGMDTIPATLARGLRQPIHLRAVVRRVVRTASGYDVVLAEGTVLHAAAVVLATPPHVTAQLLEPLDVVAAETLANIPCADLELVSLGYARRDVPHALDGTGFVSGAAEHRSLRACTWSSEKWPDRAPEGQVLFRCFVHAPGSETAELVALAREELRDLLGITAQPSLTRARIRAAAMPRCTVGHLERMAMVRARVRELDGLALAGSACGVVGVPDCIESGVDAAQELVRSLPAVALEPALATGS